MTPIVSIPTGLTKGARPDEQFHLQSVEPVPHVIGWRWFIRRTSWSHVYNRDGSPGWFVSWAFFNRIQFYHGTAKADGTRTVMYRTGQLMDDHDTTSVVMTTTPKELLAFRWRSRGVDPTPVWSNMGGA